jgi:hypothetical protein
MPARCRTRTDRLRRYSRTNRREKPYDVICWRFLQPPPHARRRAIRAVSPMSAVRCPGVPALLVGDARKRSPRDAYARAFATTLAADEGVLAAAQMQGAPAARVRFAPACVENDCAHWGGGGCELLGRIAQLLAEAGAPVRPSPAYDCSIRQDCRWRRQRGDEACGICGFVAREPLDRSPDRIRMDSRSIPA